MIELMGETTGWEEHLESISGLSPAEIFGDPSAYSLAVTLIKVSNVWDDLIDGDPLTFGEINSAFYATLVEIPGNPFYQRHFQSLHALIQNAIASFLCANEWENTFDEHGLELGHVLRYGVANVIGQIVILSRGMAAAAEILPHLYKALCGERFEEYRTEIMNRKAATDG